MHLANPAAQLREIDRTANRDDTGRLQPLHRSTRGEIVYEDRPGSADAQQECADVTNLLRLDGGELEHQNIEIYTWCLR